MAFADRWVCVICVVFHAVVRFARTLYPLRRRCNPLQLRDYQQQAISDIRGACALQWAESTKKQMGKPCKIEGCTRTTEKGAYGMCGMHAQRQRRYGDPHYKKPEEQRRANNRNAQLARFDQVKASTYRKLFGRHEHRVVAEQMLGRPLLKNEIVHHLDGNKQNNDPSNLSVMTQSEHVKLHMDAMAKARLKKHGY